MNLDAVQLLKRLEPAVRPLPTAPPSSERGRAIQPLESQPFAALMDQARRGELASGQNVRDARQSCEAQFSPAQLSRLAEAGDRAESAGAKTVAILLDGHAYVMDVAERSIIRELTAAPQQSVERVDAFIRADEPAEQAGVGTREALDHLSRFASPVARLAHEPS